MWDETGDWHPGKETIDKTLSENPSLNQKEVFIERLIERSLHKRAGNYPEVRAEIVDHYLNALGEKMKLSSKSDFIKAVGSYHNEFGGTRRIVKIAAQHEIAVSMLIRKDFFEWLRPYRFPLFISGAILLFGISQYYTALIGKIIFVSASVLYLIGIIDGFIKNYKLHKLKIASANISLFLRAPLTITIIMLLPIQSTSIFGLFMVDENAKFYSTLLISINLYLFSILYFYHRKVRSKDVNEKIRNLELELI